jgi:LysR family transcriptional regulator, transcriptional activator for dmlA
MHSRSGKNMQAIVDFSVFRAIVDSGGISAAAEALQSSPPAVSRRLASLEERLGVRLAERQSRRFRLTDEGMLLYERSCQILDQIDEAEAEVASRGDAARGLLRVSAPCDFGQRHVGALLASFSARHPALRVHLTLSDAGLEVSADGFDVVLRYGQPDDLGMIARHVATTPRVVCASPGYVAKHGVPNLPTDLSQHECILLSRRQRLLDQWTFRKGAEEHSIKVCGSLSSANGDVLRAWALSGEGITLAPLWDVVDDLAEGRLIELLRDYQANNLELFAVFAPGKTIIPRIRLFVDYITQALGGIAPNEDA